MINVLLVEDNPDDVVLTEELLSREQEDISLTHVMQLKDAFASLERASFDLILLDLSLPDATGFETVREMMAKAPTIPTIVLTAMDDQAMALHVVQAGAQDYLVKGQSDGHLMARSIRYAIERKHAESRLQESEQKFRQLAEHINAVFWIRDHTGHQLQYVSPAYERIWGRSCASLKENPEAWISAIHPEDRTRIKEAFFTQVGKTRYCEEYRIEHPDGSVRWIQDRGFPIHNEQGTVYRNVGIAEDITDQKRSEEALWAVQHILEGRSDLTSNISQGVMSWIHSSQSKSSEGAGYKLTPQQERILALVAEGKTNKEIANQLNLSDKTIRNHLAVVFEKLQLTRRTQAAAFFAKYRS